jgi:uncharacterized LabA/DUF88 family protein
MTARVYCLIDVDNVKERLVEVAVDWRQVNLLDVARASIRMVGSSWGADSMQLSRVFCYGAPTDNDMETWLQRNDALPDVTVRHGKLAVGPRRRTQKAVDVQLAVDAVAWASRDTCDAMIFMTGDADFIPVVEAVKELGPLAAVCAFRNGLSQDLVDAADRIGYLPSDPNAWVGWVLPAP